MITILGIGVEKVTFRAFIVESYWLYRELCKIGVRWSAQGLTPTWLLSLDPKSVKHVNWAQQICDN